MLIILVSDWLILFRCVDEINQGLDEKNERRVWDMILQAATLGRGSQYFYLAPKMPYNLNYRPGNHSLLNDWSYVQIGDY